jgi:hypothetical protein
MSNFHSWSFLSCYAKSQEQERGRWSFRWGIVTLAAASVPIHRRLSTAPQRASMQLRCGGSASSCWPCLDASLASRLAALSPNNRRPSLLLSQLHLQLNPSRQRNLSCSPTLRPIPPTILFII